MFDIIILCQCLQEPDNYSKYSHMHIMTPQNAKSNTVLFIDIVSSCQEKVSQDLELCIVYEEYPM